MAKKHYTWFATVNPNAGSGKTLSQWREAEKVLYEHNIDYHCVMPENTCDASKKIREACAAGYRHFMAVGGDGTAHDVLNSIVNFVTSPSSVEQNISLEDFTLAILPIGSGNDWIRSHNIPRDLTHIIGMIADEKFAMQDVVRVTLRNSPSSLPLQCVYMCNIGGYSFDANVCEVVNAQKARGEAGKWLYLNALKKITLSQKVAQTDVRVDGKSVFKGLLYTISVGNGMYSGGGLCQTPSAVMDDGLLDIMVAPKFPLWKVFTNIHKLLLKKTETIPFLKFYRGRKIEIIPKGQGQLVEVDGEVIGRAPATFEIIPQRINVLHQP